jgi:hypothetical protein
MRRFLMAVALAGVLPVAAIAGDIPSGDFVSPPPPPATNRPASSAPNSQYVLPEQKESGEPQPLDDMQALLLTILSLIY